MSANVFLENPWRWRGISDWNDAPGYEIAEHLFLAQWKKNQTQTQKPKQKTKPKTNKKNPKQKTLKSSAPFLISECPLTARHAVETQRTSFFYASLSKIATFLYRLRNNPCSSVLACKGLSWYNRWNRGLTIKKQFLQNPEGGGRRSDNWKAVWLGDMRIFIF